ncbi:MAG: FxLYD domain-containing protein [Dehalococcoidales bacterium]|jgi:hypothetical protein
MKAKTCICLGLFLLLAVSLASCAHTGNVNSRAELAVLKKELKTDAAGKVTLAVTVKNISNVNAELAEVKVNFYDAQKNLIDSERDSVLNLKPGESWDFTIPCNGDNCGKIASYEIETTAGTSSGGL